MQRECLKPVIGFDQWVIHRLNTFSFHMVDAAFTDGKGRKLSGSSVTSQIPSRKDKLRNGNPYFPITPSIVTVKRSVNNEVKISRTKIESWLIKNSSQSTSRLLNP